MAGVRNGGSGRAEDPRMQASIRLLSILALSAVAPSVAPSHQTPTGWRYDGWCCGGQDCQPIAQELVTVTPDGFLVSIPSGTHVTANAGAEKLFHYDEVLRSGDEQYHACILPMTQEFRCLYVPPFTY
jgi:hypothetical protein